jgi:TolB-like protein/DNA-binding winged helix-turn-helix (wHTH) protein/tetratricopeptide (TPR) repeat protein
MPEGKHFYEFGPFRLDPAERLLLRDNQTIPLAPKAFDTLLVLVENSGHLLTKDELMKRLWPGTFVEEVNLAQNISALRRVLDDKDGGAHYIETVAKGGYRFTAEARKIITEPPRIAASGPDQSAVTVPDPVRHRWSVTRTAVTASATILVVASVLILIPQLRKFRANPAVAIHSIAVLPLVNLSSDPSQEYFSDGMTDELITDLAKFGELKVISHTSVERYKETKRPLPEIARELRVDAVVEGRVMRSGDRVRIRAQLFDARTDQHLCAESYERDVRDILTLQDEVAQRIATQVGIKLTAGEQARLTSTRFVNPVAHEAYLKGNFYLNRLSCEGFKKALEYFQQAAAQDANFAPAYVGMAQSYFTLADWGCRPQDEAIRKSKAAALKAIELDHNLGAAHAWLGKLVYVYEWDWPKAENEFKQADELDPNYVATHLAYAVFLVATGKREQGFAEMRRAHELDPTSGQSNLVDTYVLYLTGQYDQAIEQARRTIELYPESSFAYFWPGASYERKGMDEQASAAYLKSKALEGLKPEELAAFQTAYKMSGIRGYWRHELEVTKGHKPVDTCWMASIYGHMGEKERTLETLNRGFQHHCRDLQVLNVDPIYDSLRQDPRFQDVLRRMKFPG